MVYNPKNRKRYGFMKKVIALVCLLGILATVSISLCSCGSEIDRAVRSADKAVEDRNDPEKVSYGGEYSSELVYKEAEDAYDYVITVDMTTCTITPDSVVDSMRQNIDGYFSDCDNVTIIVKVYYGESFYGEYVNWEYKGIL
jgi:hypothetical protein